MTTQLAWILGILVWLLLSIIMFIVLYSMPMPEGVSRKSDVTVCIIFGLLWPVPLIARTFFKIMN